jgi:lipopolysaccharide exporter
VSQAKKTILGSFILVSSKIVVRLLGLISTLVLARVLIPEDFGIVAISLIVLSFFDLLTLTGGKQYIIQLKDVSENDLNTAWSLNLLLKTAIVFALIVLAPFIAEHYNDERLTWVLIVISALSILESLGNPGLFLFAREQNYVPIFKLSVVQKVFTVAFTIGCALWFKNYWALVIGHLVSNLVKLVGSYIIHDFRPKFRLNNVRKQWDFSKWMMSKGVVGYARSQMDTFLVSNFYSPASVGSYHVMKYISSMPATEIIAPATQPLLATFSKSRDDEKKLQYQYSLCLLVLVVIAMPISLFINTFHQPIVSLLLGEQWLEYSNVFGVLSLLIISTALGSIASQALVAKKKLKYLFYYDVVSLCIMTAVLLGFEHSSLYQFAVLRTSVDVFLVTVLFLYTSQLVLKLSLINIAKLLLPSIISSISALYVIKFISFVSETVFIELFVNGACFFVVYLVIALGIYSPLLRNSEEGNYLVSSGKNIISHIKIKLQLK